jgi:hypothetical protein
MPRPTLLAALLVMCAAPCARADQRAVGSLRLPVPAEALAAAVGIHRIDPSTLPVDIVRLAFASPDNASAPEMAARAKLTETLARRGRGDLVPLPLSPQFWSQHVLRGPVGEDGLAAAIFARRDTALLYHGLLGMDAGTLAWIERHPVAVRVLAANAGTTAVFGPAIRIREGAVETPGEDARAIWTALAGADPAQPLSFIERLLTSGAGSLAEFYDTIARLDPAHQALAIGRRGDPDRVERARQVLAASAAQPSGWSGDRPFLRREVDLLGVFRAIAVDDRGTPRPPASRALWARIFGEGSGGDTAVDGAWLARQIFDSPPGVGRRRLEAFRFAQRALGAAAANDADLVAVLRDHARVPTLLSVLEGLGERDTAAYAAAVRVAAAIEDDEPALRMFQSALAIVDRAHRSGTLDESDARRLSRSLIGAAAQRERRQAQARWFVEALLPALRRALPPKNGDAAPDAERLVLESLAGPPLAPPIVVAWEGAEYTVDVAFAEARRLTRIRRGQNEAALDATLEAAEKGDTEPLANSLAALVYACALGEADGAPVKAGALWRRHQFRGKAAAAGGPPGPWRIATEVFGPAGWHLAGSLLRLDAALAPLALRRLDATEMPSASHLSTSDRRALAGTIALVNPQRLTDVDRDAIAAALARGRERLDRLAAAGDALSPIAVEAALSGWRQNSIAWLLATDPPRAPRSFTLLEQFRLGAGPVADQWGTNAFPLDGCVCLRHPAADPWEDYAGRPSSGQLATQLSDVMLRTADVLAKRKLPAVLARDVAAYAMQDAIDRGRPAYFDDWLPLALAVRELPDERFEDYVAALTVAGPLIPVNSGRRQ